MTGSKEGELGGMSMFFFNDAATTEIYTLSLHDALPISALSVTREVERGTMESLLAMPIRPVEIMLGKIAPYLVIGGLQAGLILDRKSTRLNSSHANISYAVFCLKKKLIIVIDHTLLSLP